VILDIVPNHMGTGDENRWWPDPEIFDIDPASGWYRRFFDIDDLAAVRVERQEVFDLLHGKVLELVRDGVDRRRPRRPPRRPGRPGRLPEEAPDAGVAHVWVEKILAVGEGLRDWPVDGTVGYEFLVDVGALFVDPAGEAVLTDLWQTVSGDARPFEELGSPPSSSWRPGRSRARSTACGPARRRRRADPGGARRAAGLPHLRRAVERGRSPTRTARRSRPRAWRPRSPGSCCSRSPATRTS
jgi:(1->4)-alpha-D-glucan 1-alpha-D-glucosylmutase